MRLVHAPLPSVVQGSLFSAAARSRLLSIPLIVSLALMTAGAVSSQPSAPRKQLVRDLRLDATTEDFPAIGSLAVSGHGTIAVGIPNDFAIRLYDSTGKKIGSVGRAGGGPGEFRRIQRMGWIGDTLWAYDNSLQRVSYFSTRAKFIRSDQPKMGYTPPVSEQGGLALGAIYGFQVTGVAAGNRLLGQAFVVEGRTPSGAPRTEVHFIVSSVDGSFHKIIGTLPRVGITQVFLPKPDTTGSFTTSVPFRFYPPREFAQDGSRFAIMETTFEDRRVVQHVTVVGIGGDTILSRDYVADGPVIPAAVRDSALNQIAALPANGRPRFPPGVAEQLRDLARPLTPKIYAPARDLLFGLDHTIWLIGRETSEGSEAVALDDKGNRVASIIVPPKSKLMRATLRQVWMVEVDDDGLPSVVRYRLK